MLLSMTTQNRGNKLLKLGKHMNPEYYNRVSKIYAKAEPMPIAPISIRDKSRTAQKSFSMSGV